MKSLVHETSNTVLHTFILQKYLCSMMSDVESFTGLTLSNRIYDALALKRIVDREVSSGALYDKQYASEAAKSPLIITHFKDLFNHSVPDSSIALASKSNSTNIAVNTKAKILFAVVCSSPYKHTNTEANYRSGTGGRVETARREMTSCSLTDLRTSVAVNAPNGDNYQNPIRLHILDPDYKFINSPNNKAAESINDTNSSPKNMLRQGMVVLLINPNIKYKAESSPATTVGEACASSTSVRNTRNITVEIFNASQIIHVGTAKHFGICRGVLATRPDGSNRQPLFKVSDKYASFDQLLVQKEARTHCSMPVNLSHSQYCCYHSHQDHMDKAAGQSHGQSRGPIAGLGIKSSVASGFSMVFGETSADQRNPRNGTANVASSVSTAAAKHSNVASNDYLSDIFSDAGQNAKSAVSSNGSALKRKLDTSSSEDGFKSARLEPDEISGSAYAADSLLFEEEADDSRREAGIRGVAEDTPCFTMTSRTTAEEVGAWAGERSGVNSSSVRIPKESSVFNYGAAVHRQKQEQLNRSKQVVSNAGGLPFQQLVAKSSVIPGVAGVGLGVRVGGVAVNPNGSATNAASRTTRPGAGATGSTNRMEPSGSVADRLLNTKANVRMQEYADLLADLRGTSSSTAAVGAGTTARGSGTGLVAVGGAGMLLNQSALLKNSNAFSAHMSKLSLPVGGAVGVSSVGASTAVAGGLGSIGVGPSVVKQRTSDTLLSKLLQDKDKSRGQLSSGASSFAALQSRHNLQQTSMQQTAEQKLNNQLVRQHQLREQQHIDSKRALVSEQNRLEVTRRQELAMKQQAQAQAQAQAKARDDEISKLLARTSSHADAETAEWFEGFGQRMKKLEAREYMAEKENNATKDGITISAQYCKECDVVHELGGGKEGSGDHAGQLKARLCVSKGHRCTAISAVKKFFECFHCQRKTSTLTPVISDSSSGASSSSSQRSSSSGSKMLIRPPMYNCSYCQKQDWRSCGSKGSYYVGGIKGDTSRAITGERHKFQPTGNGITGATTINYFDK